MDNSIVRPIYEFILWDNCNNNCKFCWQKKHPVISNEDDKRAAIDYTTIFLNSDEFQYGSHVLLVGGEIFDNNSAYIRKYIDDFFDKILYYQFDGMINLLYLNTNLLYKDTSLLHSVLDMVEDRDLFDRLKFTTSYDTYGRFNNPESEDLFFGNMKEVKDRYPKLDIVVNTIMTKQFCDKELSDTNKCFTKDFYDEHGCYVNLLPYIDVNDELTPDRNDVFKTLQKQEQFNPGYLKFYINNFNLPQDKHIYRYYNNRLNYSSSEYSECGHGENFKRYSRKGTCFICDIKELFGYA